MEILWWLVALVILFIFFGGAGSFILAYIAYFINNLIKKGSRLVLTLGLLLSGGVSYWSCRYAMEGVKLSFLDTTIAIVISLATFIVATRFLRKRLSLKTVFGKH
jgi:uncharacterized membrane protein